MGLDHVVLIGLPHLVPALAHALEAARALHRCSAPVISLVSRTRHRCPWGCGLSYMLPTVGQEERPVVVSLSPHFVEIQRSVIGLSHAATRSPTGRTPWRHRRPSRSPRYRHALDAEATTGLPVLAMPSTTIFVHWSSMPITPPPRHSGSTPCRSACEKCRSRSAPNWRRP